MEQAELEQLIDRQREGFSLEQTFYNCESVWDYDVERIISSSWMFAGHVSRIPQTGDYFLFEIAGESIIICRTDDDISAYYNVCRHRGSRICQHEAGHAAVFRCPYHHWTYNHDGQLTAARDMPADFDKQSHQLHACQVEVMEGFIFVALAPAADTKTLRLDMQRFFSPFELSSARIAARQAWRVEANWKLVMENFRECYHCAPCHPEYSGVMTHGLDDNVEQMRLDKRYVEFSEAWYQADQKRGWPASQSERTPPLEHICGRYPIQDGFVTQSQDGKPLAPLMGGLREYDGGISTVSFYPMNYIMACCDHAIAFRFTPLAVHDTEVELTWLVAGHAELDSFSLDDLKWLWLRTTEQDKRIVEVNQRGVNSRRYQPGQLSRSERDVTTFTRWYLQRLRG